MFRRCALVVCVTAIAGCSGGAPSDDQVKQALYDRYATTQGGAQLAGALKNEVSVGDCSKSGQEYRCVIENKALGTTIPMFFTHDKAQNKWTYVREGTQ